ncbi:ExbD/TolR family protein [Parasediminibacterium paludis]|uniref:ExbD/TolR family protein n=1 Tax=Parasediminibacterium paludis TaxID=908966 RepID=A0ABV8PYC3_9BACT
MAELQAQDNRKTRGVKKGKKLSTRVDLTPMVDLGFLLITFFIFTTTMSKAMAMGINLPSDKPTDPPNLTAASKTISLILGANNSITYYIGDDVKANFTTNYTAKGIRTILINKQHALGKDAKKMVVLIKPTSQASYANVVDILDEMAINGVKTYVLMEPDTIELLAAN